jgi:predicted N-acetyltransferase YhbS
MDITVRRELIQDIPEADRLIRAAFYSKEKADSSGLGCDEHYLAHLLRGAPEFIPELALVAEADGRLTGSILYSRSFVLLPSGGTCPVLTFGPLAVLPVCQRQGIGGMLVRASFDIARSLGWGAAAIYGHPSYYPRFGFREAAEYGISTDKGENFPAFMAAELVPGALQGITGTHHIAPVFTVDQQKAREFDAAFR